MDNDIIERIRRGEVSDAEAIKEIERLREKIWNLHENAGNEPYRDFWGRETVWDHPLTYTALGIMVLGLGLGFDLAGLKLFSLVLIGGGCIGWLISQTK